MSGLFNKKVGPAITGFDYMGSRMAAVGLNLFSALMTLMSVYIPHSWTPEEERLGAFSELRSCKEQRNIGVL